MLGKRSTGESIENSALITDAAAYKIANYQCRSDDKSQAWYDHCNKPRHTREKCWKLHGKPENWKSTSKERRIVGFLLPMKPTQATSTKSRLINS